ncbi:hypothetical protein E2C01_065467 [Portunus trituberculatus]|uniref:Uncharacterized protein n=1 Tax=Portunus trituberculatus TaxID=210409 RepID=A0A5B7HNG4_PORTR|nr:hypothetical protein [Portunus trituberculatus]
MRTRTPGENTGHGQHTPACPSLSTPWGYRLLAAASLPIVQSPRRLLRSLACPPLLTEPTPLHHCPPPFCKHAALLLFLPSPRSTSM